MTEQLKSLGTFETVSTGRKALSSLEREAFDYFSLGGAEYASIETTSVNEPLRVELVARVNGRVLYLDPIDQNFGFAAIDEDRKIFSPTPSHEHRSFDEAVKTWIVPAYCELVPGPQFMWRTVAFKAVMISLFSVGASVVVRLIRQKPFDFAIVLEQGGILFGGLVTGFIIWWVKRRTVERFQAEERPDSDLAR